jgi:hypothetical protein
MMYSKSNFGSKGYDNDNVPLTYYFNFQGSDALLENARNRLKERRLKSQERSKARMEDLLSQSEARISSEAQYDRMANPSKFQHLSKANTMANPSKSQPLSEAKSELTHR